ncbi:MAG: CDP-alcohol phosphatidyltransferase family protein [Prevotella sp.]|nr:CDP-alcohol phosphatidyltransferase family protein [Prevotella sp.]
MKKHIPNTITCCNLISGCIATYWALCGIYDMALLFIVIGAVFDFFDGMTARLLHVSSPIGKELDSLADDITFGLAPSAILFDFLKQHATLLPWHYLAYAAFIMAAFSALRLAKFNLDERQLLGFIGLPTPANALFWAALLTGCEELLGASPVGVWAVFVGMLLSCYLLISEIPMFALKFKHWGWRGNEIKYIFVLTSAVLLILFRVNGMAMVIAWYILLSIITSFKRKQTT